MSSYISNTKPTVFQVILNRLGIIELPLKVNCWYCSQDSYILPGSKNTVDHWYCYLCESTNARDQSGDIADPKHFEAYSENLKAPSFTRTQSTINRKNERTLCESCQNNQSIIYELLSQYIPDENDPTYKFKYDNVDQYKADLHRRYKLCDDCQLKINQLVEEQKATLRKRKINETLSTSATTVTPKQKKKHYFYPMGFCWILIHALISLFIVYAIKYPYSGRIVVNYDIIVDWLEDMLYTIREKDWEKIQLWIQNWLSTVIPDLLAFSKAIYHCLISSEDITEMCDWKTRNWIMIAIVLNFVSWPFNVWHHKLYFTFHDTSRIKNWDTFKSIQFWLFMARFVVIMMVVHNASSIVLKASLAAYLLVLVYSYFTVKYDEGKWPFVHVGVSQSSLNLDDTTFIPKNSNASQRQQQQEHQQRQRQRPPPPPAPVNFDLEDDSMSIINEELPRNQHQIDPVQSIVEGVGNIIV